MTERTSTSPRSVLIVDDDGNIRDFLAELVAIAGYPTLTASNGSEALDLIRRHRPWVVLLDLEMPIMDGWEFRRRQLEDETLADVIVIVVTGYHDPAAITAQLGVRCLTKPLVYADLLEELRRVSHEPAPK